MNARLKIFGYFLSEMSILLLAFSAWTGARGNRAMQIAVAAGTTLAVTGMAMRWVALWRKQRHKHHHEHPEGPVQ
ncbi:MAG: hypothetical protein AB7U35_03005 [Sphingobium sp.]